MQQKNNLKGILYILMAAFGFAMMSFFVRLAGDIPVFEKAFFRNFIAAIIALILLRRSGLRLKVSRRDLSAIAGRCVFGTIGLVSNFWAIGHIALADANMLNKLAPVFAVLFSIWLLKEVPSPVDFICIALALIGALFVVKPGSGLFQPGALVGVLGGLCAGIAYTFVRILGTRGVKGPVIVSWFSLFSCVVTLLISIPTFVIPTAKQLLWLLSAGASAALGQFSVTAAYTYAPAKEISVFDYSQVLFAALAAFLFWHELPDVYSVFGYILIIGAAIWRWRRTVAAAGAVTP